jgi:hypothetical protein
MAAISRAQMMKELEPGLNALFGDAYGEYADECPMIYGSAEGSSRAFEEEVKLSGMGAAPVKPEGEGISYDGGQEHFTARYVHETIALGFSITEEAVEDNLYDAVAARNTKSLARAMSHTKQVKGAFTLNNAFATTNFSAGDGNALCSSRTTVGGGTVSNVLAVAADLNETSLEDAVVAIAAFKDERGLLISAMPKRLLVHPYNQFTATRILESDLRAGTADNDLNALRTNGSIPEGYFVNHYFTSTNQKNWFIITDCPDGMKHFERKSIDSGMDNDFDTGNYRYKARERYSFGVSDYLGIYGSGAVT